MKICTVCKIEKPRKSFSLSSRSKDGLQYKCKECAKDMYREYIKKPKLIVEEKLCTKCNITKPIELFSKDIGKKDGHRPFCKECELERVTEYYQENKEDVLKYHKQYYEENKELVLERNKQWQNNNIEYTRKYFKKYYRENKEHIQIQVKKYLKTPKGRAVDRASYHRREAYKKQSISTMTADDWKEVLALFNNRCAYCGSVKDIQQDHVFPLSRGGHYIKQNIVPACKSCNSSKRASDIEEWYRQQSYFEEDKLTKIYDWIGYNQDKKIQQLSIL